MIAGKTKVGAVAVEIPRDWKAVSRIPFPAGRLPKLRAYLDGLGGGDELAALTLSGNEVNDITRAAAAGLGTGASGQMIDGLVTDGSFGLRRAATNLFRRGQCDGGIGTEWVTAGAGTITQTIDATTPPPFGPQSMKQVADGTAASQGVQARTPAANPLGLVAGTNTVTSILFKGVAGASYVTQPIIQNSDATFTNGTTTTFAATGAWQLLELPVLAVAVGKTGDVIFARVTINGTRAETFWAAHAMIESGQAIVSPYVPTTGGATATHAAGRARVPASLLTPTQGWVAMQTRVGFASGDPVQRRFFTYGVDSNNEIFGAYLGSWQTGYDGAPLGTTQPSQGGVFTKGSLMSLAWKWSQSPTPTTLGVSAGGAAWTTVVSTNVPAGLGGLSTFDIGQRGYIAQDWIDSDILWVACGIGTLTNADAAALAALVEPANIGALPSPATSLPTMFWSARTGFYQVPGLGSGDATVMPELYDTAGNLVASGDQLVVVRGSAPAWYDLKFSGVPAGVLVAAASYDAGIHAGGQGSNVVRFRSDGAGVGRIAADTFSDGAAATLASPTQTRDDMTLYGDVFVPWSNPTNLDEFTYARLPFAEAQKVLGSTATVPSSRVVCDASWHGSTLDGERGSFAVVLAGGKLDALVGERVKITRTSFGVKRSVYAFVHNALTIRPVWGQPVELSVPRRVWLQLALPGDDTAQVTVEKMS